MHKQLAAFPENVVIFISWHHQVVWRGERPPSGRGPVASGQLPPPPDTRHRTPLAKRAAGVAFLQIVHCSLRPYRGGAEIGPCQGDRRTERAKKLTETKGNYVEKLTVRVRELPDVALAEMLDQDTGVRDSVVRSTTAAASHSRHNRFVESAFQIPCATVGVCMSGAATVGVYSTCS
ncbi:uncharacterized protein LOC126188690 [Schistocerca cancellata]|uniref:uncharacterized protein LOC126188690 n=1 Tax=Schistocerca cancellata TaxID=274614 RepID=UPI00211760F9|nr:uncharacterized protein LOC126188690 [Schistocerca cancellata]